MRSINKLKGEVGDDMLSSPPQGKHDIIGFLRPCRTQFVPYKRKRLLKFYTADKCLVLPAGTRERALNGVYSSVWVAPDVTVAFSFTATVLTAPTKPG